MNTLLKLKKINLKYQTGKDSISVLKNIDLNIKKKETVSVVGESGSGKTSLIRLYAKNFLKKSLWQLFLMIFIQLRMQNI